MARKGKAVLSTASPTPQPSAADLERGRLTSERLGVIRESVQFFVKLDFALSAATAAVISFAKVEPKDLVVLYVDFGEVALYMMMLFIVGWLLEASISSARADVLGGLHLDKKHVGFAQGGLWLLAFMHAILIAGVFGYWTGYFRGSLGLTS